MSKIPMIPLMAILALVAMPGLGHADFSAQTDQINVGTVMTFPLCGQKDYKCNVRQENPGANEVVFRPYMIKKRYSEDSMPYKNPIPCSLKIYPFGGHVELTKDRQWKTKTKPATTDHRSPCIDGICGRSVLVTFSSVLANGNEIYMDVRCSTSSSLRAFETAMGAKIVDQLYVDEEARKKAAADLQKADKEEKIRALPTGQF